MITFDPSVFGDKKVWVTADLHLGHQSILDHCYRPWKNIDKHDNQLIKNINEKVSKDDILIINGDFTILNHERVDAIRRWVERINGQKILVFGNHDKLRPLKYIDIGFILAATALVLPGGILVAHDPAWATVWDRNKPVICGHVHALFETIGNVVNVGVDVQGYSPILLEDALSKIRGIRDPSIDWEDLSKNRHKNPPITP